MNRVEEFIILVFCIVVSCAIVTWAVRRNNKKER
jgi:cbb3-type cytochrome oxidase subunit 3